MKHTHAVARVLLFLFSYTPTALAWGLSGGAVVPAPSRPIQELTIDQKPDNSAKSCVHQEVLHLVRSLASAPSCVRQAANGLIKDCSSLEQSAGNFQALEIMKSQYAVRLAACEIEDAGVALPPACHTLIRGFGSSNTKLTANGKEGLANCLGALEARPQSWTSYSNARQNARDICQAARYEVEREELLATWSDFATNNQESEKVLREQTEVSRQVMADQKAQADKLKSIAESLILDVQEALESTSKALGGVQNQAADTGAVHDQILAEIRSKADAWMEWFAVDVATQREVIRMANADLSDMVSSIQAQGQEASLRMRSAAEDNVALVAQVHDELFRLATQQDSFRITFGQLSSEVEASTQSTLFLQKELHGNSQEAIAAMLRMQNTALQVTSALEGAAAVADVLSAINGRFRSASRTVVATIVLLFAVWLMYGARGIVVSCILIAIFSLNDWSALSSKDGLVSMYAGRSTGYLSFWIAFTVSLVFLTLIVSGRTHDWPSVRKARGPWTQVEEHLLPIQANPGFSPRRPRNTPAGPSIEIRYYDPSTDSFKSTAPQHQSAAQT